MYYLPEYLRKEQTGRKRTADYAGIEVEITTSPKKSRIDEDDDAPNFNTIFPEEIKSLIFENLSFKDLMTSSLVCKEWNTIISENKKLTRKMVYKYQNADQVDGVSSEFTRQYVNFKFQELPIDLEFEQKFGHIREFIKSITIHVNVEFSTVKRFLDSFPNLTSLEFVDVGKSSISNHLILPKLNLPSMKHFIISSYSRTFTKIAVELISQDVQLKSFKLKRSTYITYINRDVDPITQSQLSESVCIFLNRQDHLKHLNLSYYNSLNLLTSKIVFNPRFQLEELNINCCHQPFEQNNAESLRRLLGTCVVSCKSLELEMSSTQLAEQIFSEALVNLEILEDLTLGFHGGQNYNVILSSVLSHNLMKCQLKSLTVSGRFSGLYSQALSQVLMQQKNSLVSLTLNSTVYCNNSFWSFLGRQTMIKVLRVPYLSKTALNRIKGSLIEKLVTTVNSPISKTDETFWERFRSRNPNFKSIKYEPSYFFY